MGVAAFPIEADENIEILFPATAKYVPQDEKVTHVGGSGCSSLTLSDMSKFVRDLFEVRR
jgi:hypothetical protein